MIDNSDTYSRKANQTAPSPHPLEELARRVEEGAGEDRELECLIAAATDIQIDGTVRTWRDLVNSFGIEWAVEVANRWQSIYRTEIPRYTTDLSSVVSLLERVLPGWGHGYATGWYGKGTAGGFVFPPDGGADLLKATLAKGSSPARALLAAALKALALSRTGEGVGS